MNFPAITTYRVDILLLVLLATLWGASYSFIKVGVETIPPITLIAGRTVIAGALLWLIIAAGKVVVPRDWRSWRSFMFQACLNSVVPFTLIAWAQQTVDAGVATILNSTSPIFVFLFTLMLGLSGQRGLLKTIGVALGFTGIFMIVGIDALSGATDGLIAELAIVAATICYAGAAIFGRRFQGMNPLIPAAGSLVAGSVLLIPVSLIVEQPWTQAPSTGSVLALIGLAVFSTALALVIYFRLLASLGPIGTTAQAYLRVPIGVGISAVFLGERLPLTAWLGMACVVAAVVAMTLPERPKQGSA